MTENNIYIYSIVAQKNTYRYNKATIFHLFTQFLIRSLKNEPIFDTGAIPIDLFFLFCSNQPIGMTPRW